MPDPDPEVEKVFKALHRHWAKSGTQQPFPSILRPPPETPEVPKTWTAVQLEQVEQTPQLAENLRALISVHGGGTMGEQISAQFNKSVASATVALFWILISLGIGGLLFGLFLWWISGYPYR